MTTYVETFRINGMVYGIEDTQAHPRLFETHEDDAPRYKVWARGSGIGGARTIEGARSCVQQHARTWLDGQRRDLEDKLSAVRTALAQLGTELFNLGRFKVD